AFGHSATSPQHGAHNTHLYPACKAKNRIKINGLVPGPSLSGSAGKSPRDAPQDRKSTRLNSSYVKSSYAAFFLKKEVSLSREVVSNSACSCVCDRCCLRAFPTRRSSDLRLRPLGHLSATRGA